MLNRLAFRLPPLLGNYLKLAMTPTEIFTAELPLSTLSVSSSSVPVAALNLELELISDGAHGNSDNQNDILLDPFVGELSPELELELLFDRIASALNHHGYIVVPQILSSELTLSLAAHLSCEHDLQLRRAGVGREGDFQLNGDIRRDKIQWLEPDMGVVTQFLSWMDKLRIGLNRRLFLGLREYESHFAVYEPGAFYQKHLDAFKGEPGRKLSMVFYLNEDWMQGDGGELLLYDEAGLAALERIAPQCGKMVIFLSEDFPHEVLVAHRRRQSIAGWFRI